MNYLPTKAGGFSGKKTIKTLGFPGFFVYIGGFIDIYKNYE
jgi:hypothetical protein